MAVYHRILHKLFTLSKVKGKIEVIWYFVVNTNEMGIYIYISDNRYIKDWQKVIGLNYFCCS